jgi:WD40 repeat protein
MIKEKDRTILTLKPEEGSPYSVDWSPDGTRLAVGGSKGGVEVFTAEGKRLWRKVEHSGEVFGISWAPNDLRIASASLGRTIRVYDAASGDVVLRGNTSGWGIAWSPDSERLAWYVDRGLYIVEIFDASTGQPLVNYRGHTGIVWKVCWSPKENLLASGSNDQAVHIWDATNGECLHELEGHKNSVMDLKWSPGGQSIASASRDKTIRVWDIKSGKCLLVCKGHTNDIWSVSWSPDGGILASGSEDGTARLWDAKNGKQLLKLDYTKQIQSVAFSPDGGFLAAASIEGFVRVLDVSDFTQVAQPTIRVPKLIHYVRHQAATVGRKPLLTEKPVWVPHLPEEAGECLGVLKAPTESYYPELALSQDGKAMATGHRDGIVRYWNLETGVQKWGGNEHNKQIMEIAASPDGKYIASASGDKTIKVWNSQDGRCILSCKGHNDGVKRVRWSPDGRQLASIDFSRHKNLRIWDAFTGECLMIFDGHHTITRGLSWSLDGRQIASGDDGGNIIIWDAFSGEKLKEFKPHKFSIVNLCWSPDNRYLLSVHHFGKVLVMNASNGSILFHCDSGASTDALDWSKDGSLIATRDREETIRIWDSQTWKQLKSISYKDEDCQRLAFSPDSAFIVSSHKGDVFRFWDLRDLLEKDTDTTVVSSPGKALSIEFRLLPTSLAQLLRLKIYPPLSLVGQLIELLGHPQPGKVGALSTFVLAQLFKENKGLQGLAKLRWPGDARIGLAALLLRDLPDFGWKPPQEATLAKVRDALIGALKGEEIEPHVPPPPIAILTQAAKTIDDRLLTLLTMLGPEAVAADPGLPIRLLERVKHLPAMAAAQRRLLGVRVSFAGVSGRSMGRAPGANRGQIGGIEMGRLLSDWGALLPSQLAMPKIVQTYRYIRGELLFRAREMAEPPRLRPTVLLLDVSPPCFGPVEAITRLAAFTMAQSLRKVGVPVVLVTNGDGVGDSETVLELRHPQDLLEIWTMRSLKPANAKRCLQLANVMRESLRDGEGLEPVIIVLTQPWFGAEEEIKEVKELRGLFVQYPGYHTRPVLADVCEIWHSLEPGQTRGLGQVLGRLMI